MKKTNKTWTTVFVIISLFVVFSHLYEEVTLVLELYILPQMDTATKLKFHESLGIFAPGVYLVEGGIGLFKSLTPILRSIKELVLIINSLLLVLSLVISYFVFKRKMWAGITISLLAIIPVVVWLDI